MQYKNYSERMGFKIKGRDVIRSAIQNVAVVSEVDGHDLYFLAICTV